MFDASPDIESDFLFIHRNRRPTRMRESYKSQFLGEKWEKGEVCDILYNYSVGAIRQQKENSIFYAAVFTTTDSENIMPPITNAQCFNLLEIHSFLNFLAIPYRIFEECEKDLFLFNGGKKKLSELMGVANEWKNGLSNN